VAGAGQPPLEQVDTGREPGRQRPGASRPHTRGRLYTRWRAAFFALAVLAILAGVAWALLGSRFFIVRSVKVTGTGPMVHRARVLSAARIPLGVPLIRVNGSAVARRVENIRQVQSAHVSIDWPGTVVISVQLRRPVFAVAGAGGYALVDAYGVDVRDTTRSPRALPLLTLPGATAGAGPESLRGSPTVRAAAAVLRELPARVERRVTAVTAAGPSDVSVRLKDGVTVVWGGTGNVAAKITELRVLMRRPATLYDVSSPVTAVTEP
jgi:cell division protein FtsQ